MPQRVEPADDLVAVVPRVEPRRVDEPRPLLRALVHRRDAVDLGDPRLVPGGHAGAADSMSVSRSSWATPIALWTSDSR